MKKFSLRFAFVALVLFSVSFSAFGEESAAQRLGTWYTSSWTGGFTAAARNILRGKMPDVGST
ncbi:MAG: hypothetical protein IKZ36_04425, partial [Kiritimatiellae bacterium]|nr:hypothetical protein [Kiritimatiellia bacterium]